MQTGFATDPELRFAASSGGALSAILVHLLESGTVDAVIQTPAAPEVAVANVIVPSETVMQVQDAAGSRYAPSALRALAAEDPRVDTHIPIMLSFFCAGVPSQTGAEAILTALGTDLGTTKAFRYRGHGWPGRATAQLKDGTERSMTYHDSWGGILSNHTQMRCKICADGTGKAADLVCADAWHCDEKGYPLFEEQDGISLIVARTATGVALLDAARKTNQIETQPFDPADLAAIQPGQLGRRRALLARLAGLRILGRPVPRYRGLHVAAAARQNKIRSTLRNFLGIVRRGLTGRLDARR